MSDTPRGREDWNMESMGKAGDMEMKEEWKERETYNKMTNMGERGLETRR